MNRLMKFLVGLAVIATVAVAPVLPVEARAVVPGIRAVEALADTFRVRLVWGQGAAAPLGRPPTGYEWEIAHGIESGVVDAFGPTSDSLSLVTGSTGVSDRSAEVSFVVPCEAGITDYHVRGRVRSTNSSWRSPSAWIESARLDIPCRTDAPGTPPATIELDTIGSGTPPDSTTLELASGEPIDSLRFTALGSVEHVCGVTWRNGQKRALGKEGTSIVVRGTALETDDVAGDWRCVRVTSIANGSAAIDLHLCDVDATCLGGPATIVGRFAGVFR